MKSIKIFCFLLSWVIVCYSCSTSHIKRVEKPETSIDVVSLVNTRCQAWSVFEARFRVKSIVGQRTSRYVLHIWRKEKKLRLDVSSLWGQTLATAVLESGSSGAVWLVGEKKVYLSNNSERLIYMLTGVSVRPFSLVDFVSGCFSRNFNQHLSNGVFDWCGFPLLCGLNLGKPFNIVLSFKPYFDLSSIEKLPLKVSVISRDGILKLSLLTSTRRNNIPDDVFKLNIPHDIQKYFL